MGIWKHLEGAAVEQYSHPFAPAPHPPHQLPGQQSWGEPGDSCGHSQETMTCTETSARPTSFSAQQVTFFLLRSLVTSNRVSCRTGSSTDSWVREKRSSAGAGGIRLE